MRGYPIRSTVDILISMVSFVCNACQETVKKNKVDAHSWRCRNCWVLTCIDCGVDFEGEAYKAHTSCISEAEKYQGKLYRGPKTGAGAALSAGKGGSKKQDPQVKWTAAIHIASAQAENGSMACSAGAASALQKFIERGDTNVPRKRKKFGNFVKNTLHVRDDAIIDEAFEVVMKVFKDDGAKEDAKREDIPKAATVKDDKPAPAEKGTSAPSSSKPSPQRTWKRACISILKQSGKKDMRLKKLHSALSSEKEMDLSKLKRKISKSSKFEFVSPKQKRVRLVK